MLKYVIIIQLKKLLLLKNNFFRNSKDEEFWSRVCDDKDLCNLYCNKDKDKPIDSRNSANYLFLNFFSIISLIFFTSFTVIF